MDLRMKDANGNPLRLGDHVLINEEKARYYGVIERNPAFGTPMVRVLKRKYVWQQDWESMAWRTTQYQVLRGRKRYPFSRRVRGVYLQEAAREEYAAPLPYAM